MGIEETISEPATRTVNPPELIDFADFEHETTMAVQVIPGEMTCAPSCLFSMGMIDGDSSQGTIDGPFSYLQLQDMYRPLKISVVAKELILAAAEEDRFVLHMGAAHEIGHAVGVVPEPATHRVCVHDSRNRAVVSVPEDVMYDLITGSQIPCRLLAVTNVANAGDAPTLEEEASVLQAGVATYTTPFVQCREPGCGGQSFQKAGTHAVRHAVAVVDGSDTGNTC